MTSSTLGKVASGRGIPEILEDLRELLKGSERALALVESARSTYEELLPYAPMVESSGGRGPSEDFCEKETYARLCTELFFQAELKGIAKAARGLKSSSKVDGLLTELRERLSSTIAESASYSLPRMSERVDP